MGENTWRKVLDTVIDKVPGKLLISNQEEILNYCLKNARIRVLCETFIESCRDRISKSVFIPEFIEKGKEEYIRKDYMLSLASFSQAILNGLNEDNRIAVAYSNRSFVLRRMGYIKESLADIRMALVHQYPEQRKDSLLFRLFKCLLELGEISEARKVLITAFNASGNKGFRKVIEKQLEEIKNLKDAEIAEVTVPEPVGGENENFVSASNYLSVHYDKIRGRHVIATEDIQVGDILFVEEPFAFSNMSGHCSNCLKVLKAIIPCLHCTWDTYCSSKCRTEFWKSFHSFECGFGALFKSIGIAHLSLRIVLTVSKSLDELKRIIHTIPKPEYKNGIVPYRSKGYDSVYNLIYNSDKIEGKDMIQYVTTAFLLALFLKKNTNYFPEASDISDIKFVTSILLRHILQLICNGHASHGLVFKTKKSFFNLEDEISTSMIYTSSSMMNHSCEPSVFIRFHEKRMEVRAIKPIKKGEEVFNCYGPDARQMSRPERQEILSKQYFFKCQCQACTKKYDPYERVRALKCTKCNGPSVIASKQSIITICLSCGDTGVLTLELLDEISNFYDILKEGKSLFENDTLSSLRKFIQSWRIGKKIFYAFNEDLNAATDGIARCALDFGEKGRMNSLRFLKCGIRSVEERFGCLHVNVIAEIEKFSSVLLTNMKLYKENPDMREFVRLGVLYNQKAQKIMNLLCGPDYESVVELQRELRIMEKFLEENDF